MRMLLNVKIPHAEFNAAVRNGTAGEKLQKILQETRPEAAYFTEEEGHRAAILIVNIDHPSQVPSFAEPWFLGFNADVEFKIVMTPADLQEAGLAALGKKWG